MVNEFFEPIGQFFTDLWTGISDTASEIWTVITDYFSESWSSFIELANSILSPLGEFLVDCGRVLLKQLLHYGDTHTILARNLEYHCYGFRSIISLISTVLEAGWLLIQAGAQIAWAAISQYIIQPIQEAYDWVSTKIGELVTWLSTQWELIKALCTSCLGLI